MAVAIHGQIVNHLADIMTQRHMSVRLVASTCGLERLTVRKYRDGRVRSYDAETLTKLCAGLGVPLDALLTFVPNGTARAKRR